MRTTNQTGVGPQAQEPILVAQINWLSGGTYLYADKSFSGWSGRILSFSGIRSEKTQNNFGMIAYTSLELDDFDGHLKTIVDTAETEGSTCILYHYFAEEAGVPTAIFRGKVSSLVQWSEGERKFRFDLTSAYTSNAIGHQVEQDQFGANNDVAINKPWPMVFGKVAHSPAILVQETPRSRITKPMNLGANIFNDKLWDYTAPLAAGEKIKNFHLKPVAHLESVLHTDIDNDDFELPKQNLIFVEDISRFPQNEEITLEIDGIIFKGQFNNGVFEITTANAAKWEDVQCAIRPIDDPDYSNPKVAWLVRKDIDLANHFVYTFTPHDYNTTRAIEQQADVVKARQLLAIVLQQEGSSGEIAEAEAAVEREEATLEKYQRWAAEDNTIITENLCVRQEGTKVWFKYPWRKDRLIGSKTIDEANSGVLGRVQEWGLATQVSKFNAVHAIARNGLILEIEDFKNEVTESLDKIKEFENVDDTLKSPFGGLIHQLELLKFIKNAFWSARSGQDIRQWNPPVGDVYIANLFTSEEVLAVYGVWQDEEGHAFFSPIPKILYTINLSRETNLESGPQNVTTIEFIRPLDTLKGQAWDKAQIYVTLESTIGSNTAAIIEYLLDSYTDLLTDGSTFASVAAALTNYPSHFTISERPDALAVCQEIAWQARCALICDGPTIKIKYLSKKPSTNFTINEAKTLENSPVLEFTPAEEVTTRLVGKWRRSYAPEPFDVDAQQVYENNFDKYGKREQQVEMYIYNDATLVDKSLLFWGTRYSNVWRLFHATAFPEAFGLEVYDTVATNYSTGLLGSLSQKTVVYSVHNPVHDGLVHLSLWTPAIAGSVTTHPLAWLDDSGDSIPDNPADLFEESNAAVFYARDEFGVDEVMRELRKLESSSKRLAKIVRVHEEFKNTFYVDYYMDGWFKPATHTERVVVDTNPQHNLRVGDWIEVERGQDGVHICHRLVTRAWHGVVFENSRDEDGYNEGGMKYNVKLLNLAGGITDVAYNILKHKGGGGSDLDDIQIVAFNLAEMVVASGAFPHAPVGWVYDGEIVDIYHTTTSEGRGIWWFNRSIPFVQVATSCMFTWVLPGQFVGEIEEEINTVSSPTLVHVQKIEDGDSGTFTEMMQANHDTGCPGGHAVLFSPKFEWDVARSVLRVFPQCRKFDYSGHFNFEADGWVGDEGFDCGEPIEVLIDTVAATDRLVAAKAGETPGYLEEVLLTEDPWIEMIFTDAAIAFYTLKHSDPQAVDGLNEINCLEQITSSGQINFKTITYNSDAKGHLNGNFGNNDDFVVRINPDDLWLEITNDIEVGTGFNTADFNHIGPAAADEAFEFPNVSSVIVTEDGSNTTAKGTKVEINGHSLKHDARGHCLEEINQDTPTEQDEFYVPQMLKHLKDVDDTLAPASGDLLKFDGAEWVKVTPVTITVVTNMQVDGTTRKLQKKTQVITVLPDANTESGWTDVHTGVECP